jgi:hypothetical protein
MGSTTRNAVGMGQRMMSVIYWLAVDALRAEREGVTDLQARGPSQCARAMPLAYVKVQCARVMSRYYARVTRRSPAVSRVLVHAGRAV